ncbi:hypothetical protein FB45DRAFT_44784 [Roridomyces roridus]|uniref:FAD-binding domain-containing protein n=1 Tax=Roridomyces roridus TaxID=1738132 RepID=A0AAD7BRR5_9AGAR|nr:hypothetical protein FB45DRAFT_44784 [Roridomyces roridus]
MSLPSNPITIVIVGAGPAGMAAALSLHHQGIKDFVIVDSLLAGQNSSRAVVIQAATLEALDTVGCMDKLLKIGDQNNHFGVRDESSYLFSADFSLLAPYTKFPFGLVLPQTSTEGAMLEAMKERGIHVLRPYKAVSLKPSAENEGVIDVEFESGEVVQAKYVIGADGAHSVVRNEAGISFTEPGNGQEPDLGNVSQLILGDVTFSSPPHFPDPKYPVFTSIANNNFLLIAPFPAALSHDPERIEYRVAAGVPVEDGTAPHAPSKEYIQSVLDRCAPSVLNLPRIENTYWTSRYRTRAAVAERSFARLAGGGAVLLVGDAAHIHSPLGGQGMSLGIRDAISLGAALPAVLAQDDGDRAAVDKLLTIWAGERHKRALGVVQITKGALGMVIAPRTFMRRIGFALLRFLGRFTLVQRMVAYRLSGLAEI